MGSFIGHAVPGAFFFLFGSWWIVSVLYRYYKTCDKKCTSFRNSPTYSVRKCRCGSLDIEGMLGVIAATIGIFVEIIAACYLRGKEVGVGNIQHATMYFFFGVAALSSLLKPTLQRFFTEYDKVRYILLAQAMLAEGILFKFHLYGRDTIDIMAHTLLLYCIWLSAAVTLGEMVYRDSVLLALGRGAFTVLQGTWFWQAAFILYNPLPNPKPWDDEDHHQLMLIACYFTWHVAVIVCSIIVVGIVMSCVLRKDSYRQGGVALQEISTERGSQYMALLNDRDDNETFEE